MILLQDLIDKIKRDKASEIEKQDEGTLLALEYALCII